MKRHNVAPVEQRLAKQRHLAILDAIELPASDGSDQVFLFATDQGLHRTCDFHALRLSQFSVAQFDQSTRRANPERGSLIATNRQDAIRRQAIRSRELLDDLIVAIAT